MILHTIVLLCGIAEIWTYPQRVVILPAHSIQGPIQDNNVLFYNTYKQGFGQPNGLVYVQNEPPRFPGYFEPGTILTDGPTSHPSDIQPQPDPVESEPVAGNPESDDSTSATNEPTTPALENKKTTEPTDSGPIKLKDAYIEELEPDAELIPDSIKPKEKPKPPTVPVYPYPQYYIPGRRFYIVTNPQYIPNNQVHIPLSTRPVYQYSGFQRGFPTYVQPNYAEPAYQDGQTYYVQYPAAQLRSKYSQKIQVPPLAFNVLGRQSNQFDQPRINVVTTVTEEGRSTTIKDEQQGEFDAYVPHEYGVEITGKTQTEEKSEVFNSFQDIEASSEPDDSVVIEASDKKQKNLKGKDLKEDPALAIADPQAISLTGNGGTAQSEPSGTAIVGPEGLAVSNPVATAVSGQFLTKKQTKPKSS